MKRKYYEAYDERYRQVHSKDLQWFYDDPTPVVMETIKKLGIRYSHNILELGCGEGRDAYPLLKQGYKVLATDISMAAIQYAQKKFPKYADNFAVLDCVAGVLPKKFDFIYGVAVVHMLVDDADRDAFYTFIRDHLNPKGIALICTMGDGTMERHTDTSSAFELCLEFTIPSATTQERSDSIAAKIAIVNASGKTAETLSKLKFIEPKSIFGRPEGIV